MLTASMCGLGVAITFEEYQRFFTGGKKCSLFCSGAWVVFKTGAVSGAVLRF
jgi:hypothetical protein